MVVVNKQTLGLCLRISHGKSSVTFLFIALFCCDGLNEKVWLNGSDDAQKKSEYLLFI